MTIDNSFISRQESSALKGLLMLLIVLGHIRGITNGFQMYLYSFHVQCFFILPFLYPAKRFTSANVTSTFLKLFWPFLLLYVFQILMAIFLFHNSSFTSGKELIEGIPNGVLGAWSFITGGMTLIDKFCGTQFLWFLPCFLAMTLIRMWFADSRRPSYVLAILLAIGACAYVAYSVLDYRPFLPEEYFIASQAISPLSIWQGTGFFALGFSVVWLIKRLKVSNELIWWGLVVVCTVIYALFNNDQIVFRFSRFFYPLVFFMAFYSSRTRLARSIFLQKVGTHSLAIYLIHPFLCIMGVMVIPEYLQRNVGVICIQFIIILALSYFIAEIIEKAPFLRKILFPRGEEIGLRPK